MKSGGKFFFKIKLKQILKINPYICGLEMNSLT